MGAGSREWKVLVVLVGAAATACGGHYTTSPGEDRQPSEGLAGSPPAHGSSGAGFSATGGMVTASSSGRGGSASGSNGGSGATDGGGGFAASGGASGSGSSGSAATCTTPEPCGGPLDGDWKVVDSCLRVSGEADVSPLGLGCSSMPIDGTLSVNGTFSVGPGGVVDDRTFTTGAIEMTVPSSCLLVSGVIVDCASIARVFPALGYESATCRQVGDDCRCVGTVNQMGTMGLVSASPSGEGKADVGRRGFSVTAPDGTVESYTHCTRYVGLTISPQGGGLRGFQTGEISLERLPRITAP